MIPPPTIAEVILTLREELPGVLIEWMYPGFLALHFDGGYVACDGNDGWTFIVRGHDGIDDAEFDTELHLYSPLNLVVSVLASMYREHVKPVAFTDQLASALGLPQAEPTPTAPPTPGWWFFDYKGEGALGLAVEFSAVSEDDAVKKVRTILKQHECEVELATASITYQGTLYLYPEELTEEQIKQALSPL